MRRYSQKREPLRKDSDINMHYHAKLMTSLGIDNVFRSRLLSLLYSKYKLVYESAGIDVLIQHSNKDNIVKNLTNYLDFLEQYKRYTGHSFDKSRYVVQRIFEIIGSDISRLKFNGSYTKLINILQTMGQFHNLRGLTEIENLLRSKKSRKNNRTNKEIKERDSDDSRLLYNSKIFTRYMDKKRFDIWKDLYESSKNIEDVNIERIIKSKNLRYEVKVESENEGSPLRLYNFKFDDEQTSNKLFRGERKVRKYTRPNLAFKLSILRQIIKTITFVWSKGYVHGHPHASNWNIRIREDGKPVVTLIDFDLCKENIERHQGSEIGNLDATIRKLNLPRYLSNSFISILKSKLFNSI